MNMNSKPRRNPSAIWRELDGETAIISGDGANLHMLNEVGGRIWALLDGEHDLDAIASFVAAEFTEELNIVVREALEFAINLKDLNLVENGKNGSM